MFLALTISVFLLHRCSTCARSPTTVLRRRVSCAPSPRCSTRPYSSATGGFTLTASRRGSCTTATYPCRRAISWWRPSRSSRRTRAGPPSTRPWRPPPRRSPRSLRRTPWPARHRPRTPPPRRQPPRSWTTCRSDGDRDGVDPERQRLPKNFFFHSYICHPSPIVCRNDGDFCVFRIIYFYLYKRYYIAVITGIESVETFRFVPSRCDELRTTPWRRTVVQLTL